MAGRNVRSVKRALDESLRHVDQDKIDAAALALAKRYASHIDEDPECLAKIGPLLLDALRDLRMTPKSRAVVVKGGQSNDGGSKWDELEQRRTSRRNGTASVDSSPS